MRPRVKNRHLPPCIYKRGPSYYLVKAGKWERLGTNLATVLAEYGRRLEQPVGGMAELIDKVLLHIAPSKSATTNRQYRKIGDKLKEIFVEFSPEQVQAKHVAAIKVRYAATPFYANRLVSVLRLIASVAVEWQILGNNPAIGISRHTEAKRDRYITDAEYAAIHAKAGPRLQAIIELCYLTGQRISDVLKIRYSDLSEAGIAFRQGKTGAKLMVTWNDSLRATVARAKALHGNVQALTLLHNRRGKPPDYSTVKLQWDKARKAAGVPDARIHDLRAKALTDAKRQGFNPQTLAGHTDGRMTERYIRLRETPQATGPSFDWKPDGTTKKA